MWANNFAASASPKTTASPAQLATIPHHSGVLEIRRNRSDGAHEHRCQDALLTRTPGETPWLQLDLGEKRRLSRIEVVLRQDLDQPETRKNFQVLGSNTPDFKSPTVLGTQGASALAHQATWSVNLTGKTPYRYLRISKTTSEYFFVAEVRAF